MKQEQAGELKASLGAGKLSADQIRIRELERELSIAKTERDTLMALGQPLRYAMIHKFRNQHPITRLCTLVDVAKSGYQAWCAGKVTSPRKLEEVRLVVAIKAAHQRGRGIYGPEKIQSELLAQSILASLNRIKRLRRLHSIRCTHKKKFKVTTDSKHSLPFPL